MREREKIERYGIYAKKEKRKKREKKGLCYFMLALTFTVLSFNQYYIGQFERTPRKSQCVSSKSQRTVV